jgi:hypothetical protein
MQLKFPAKNNPWLHAGLFFLLLLLSWHFFHYADILPFGPTSQHNWRQSDSASLALSYYNNGMEFFRPSVHNIGIGGTGSVGEFPILYYVAAGLYHLFGPNEAVLRLLHYLFFVLGIWGFSRINLRIFNNAWVAVLLAGIFLTMRLSAYFSFNFIPNTVSLGLMLFAAWLYFRYYQSRWMGWYWIAMTCVLIGGLIKPTMLVLFLAWASVWGLSTLFSRVPFFQVDRKLFPKIPVVIITIAAVMGAIFLWMYWGRSYNKMHRSWVFMMEAAPAWELDRGAYKFTWKRIRHWLDGRIYFAEFNYIIAVAFGLNCLFIRRFPPFIRWFFGFVTLGTAAYMALFFKQFIDHNYYFFDFFPFLMLTLSMSLYLLKSYWPKVFHHWGFVLVLLVIFNMGLNNARIYMDDAYDLSKSIMPTSVNPSFYHTKELRAYVEEIGIKYEEHQILSIPDKTPNLTLYYLNRNGFTRIKKDVSDWEMNEYIKQGADFLVVSDAEVLESDQVKPFLIKPIGVFESSIFFFDLRGFHGKN